MRETFRALSAIGMAVAVSILAACGGSDDTPKDAAFTTALIGDMPYGTSPTDTTAFNAHPAFISAVNADADVSLVLHAGDIHSGKQYCTQAYDQSIHDQWTAFKDPVIYTPGDNEWSDCHKAKEGGGTFNALTGRIDYVVDSGGNLVDYAGGDPMANLALVRSIFFGDPTHAFGGQLAVHSQAVDYDKTHRTDRDYSENVWFEKSGVLFVTLNIPGGSNNDTDPWYGAPVMSPAQQAEVDNRSAANLRWLDAAFARAGAAGDVAVVIMEQADMWDLDGKLPAANHLSQYKPFIDAIAAKTTAFGKPVLLINGDSHFYRSDNPLVRGAPCTIETGTGTAVQACSATTIQASVGNPADPYDTQPNGYNVANFHRIVVHGNLLPLEMVKLRFEPASNAAGSAAAFGPFSWTRIQP